MNSTPSLGEDTAASDGEANDDEPVGIVLTRRQVLGLFAAPALLGFGGCSAADPTDTTAVGSCVAKPELTEGPYYVDENLNRSDIRPDTGSGALAAGLPLALAFNVSQINGSTCQPLPNAVVDVWHCDALGVYSDVGSAAGRDFLRGLQVTDAAGQAAFTTVYPGWYRGRAVHVHFKVRSSASSAETYEFTSQLFFDDAFSDAVYQNAPYAGRGTRDTRNASDGIYRQGGTGLLLATTGTPAGYAATFDIALVL